MLLFSGLWPDLWGGGGKVVGSGDRIGKSLQENLWSFLPPLDFPVGDCFRGVHENQLATAAVFVIPSESLPRKPRSL